MAILVRDRVSVGVGLRRFIGRLIIERHRARFESQSAGTMTFGGPVRVTRSWLAPLGVNTDVVLGHDSASGNEEVVLTTGWRSGYEVIRALQSAGIQIQIRRKPF
ncbi:MAG TPA: hypothetical protein VGR26_18890 [Acidimicrobiales bacterium]|nr:hypothetical protein [Acidimicrobiales bacterium]